MLVLDLPPELEAKIREKAEQQGMTAEAFVIKILMEVFSKDDSANN
ncbi:MULTISPECIES: hypothetical protein [unclassified Moraxella]